MQRQIRTSSGEILNMSPRLVEALEATDNAGALDREQARSLLQLVESRGQSDVQSALLLKAATYFIQQTEAENAVLCLAMYAKHESGALASKRKPAATIGFFADVLDLVHNLLACSQPESVRKLAHLLGTLTEEAFALCAQTAFLEVFAGDDVTKILRITATIWGPDTDSELRELEHLVPVLSRLAEGDLGSRYQRIETEELTQALIAVRERISAKRLRQHRARKRQLLMVGLVDAWIQMTQRPPLAKDTINRGHSDESLPQGPNQEVQIRELIREVEQQLRTLIAGRYAQQFGSGWVQHIEAKHKAMYEYWLRNLSRDRATFGSYPQHSPEILEYARLEDLSQLITAQWHLFRAIFDFGYGARNKAAFCDKMDQIARVRNPLAHHRSIPENEMMRGMVLCTDMLLAVGRSTKGIKT